MKKTKYSWFRVGKRIIFFSAFLFLFSFLSLPVLSAQGVFSFEQYFTHYDDFAQLLVGDVDSGEIYYEKAGREANAIASMSKLMTYYVVKEAMSDGKINAHDKVEISAHAASFNRDGSSNYGLKEGDHFTVDRLLRGMMVISGNDAAVALAEHAAGSEDQFVQLMNQAAASLDMQHTHFVNACGLTRSDGTYSEASPEDMFKLARTLLDKYPELADYGSIRELREPERDFVLPSTFEESGMNQTQGFHGLKSGYTERAGVCMTSYNIVQSQLTDREFHILTIIMGAHNNAVRRQVIDQALDLVSSSLLEQRLVTSDLPCGHYEVRNGKSGTIDVRPVESFIGTTFIQTPYVAHYQMDRPLRAPIKKGDPVGHVNIMQNGEVIKSIEIISDDTVEKLNFFNQMTKGVGDLFEFFSDIL